MKDFYGTEHGIVFTGIDLKENKFVRHLSLCVGDTYEEGLKYFNQIKESYPKHEEPEIVIDFIDSNWDVLDDYPISKENARHLAMRMGYVLKE